MRKERGKENNEAMKMSFSLSSLHLSSESLERQRRVGTQAERPYNSLTKKRKDPKQAYRRRMWTNREDCKDDFWAAIRSNYDYIMDTNLIDNCKEANGELIWDEGDVSTQSWNLKEVSCQFSELYSWLRILQELVYSKEENLLDKDLRAAHMEELRRKSYRRKLFNEQAEKLVSRAPALKDEVAWRVEHLNAKWESVERIMAPVDRLANNRQDVTADFEHEVRCLRKWLREMESHLKPLSFNVDWTLAELEEKAMEHMVLQRDIEAHGRIVSSVVKLSERVSAQQQREQESNEQQQQQQQIQKRSSPQALRVARSLERRWHLLFLRALEWQCHIETLVSRVDSKKIASQRRSSDESDEEPVTKQPRLTGNGRGECEDVEEHHHADRTTEPSDLSDHYSDSEASSENRSVGDGSYFEDELCQCCVMDAKRVVSENPEKESSRKVSSRSRGSDDEEEAGGDMPPTSPTGLNEERRRPAQEAAASFVTSDRKSKNCATFYFKHLDTESETDCFVRNEDSPNLVDDSSEEEWTYASASNGAESTEQRGTTSVKVEEAPREIEEMDRRPTQPRRDDDNNEEEAKRDKKSIQRLITEVDKLVREERCTGTPRAFPSLVLESKGKKRNYRAKYARIKRWLRLNSSDGRPICKPLDSCDASGEYTSEESEGEKESMSSDDMESSVATYRRFEGCTARSTSQEILEVSLDASTPKVVMRTKSKTNGPRPWSVSCISQIGAKNEGNGDPISHFSISETALHRLAVSTPPTKSMSFDATGSRKSFDNSTSTLLEESAGCRDGRFVRSNSFRKRKNRLRKRNASRKSESSSEVANGHHFSAGSDGSSHQPRSARKANSSRANNSCSSTRLVKSESFSGSIGGRMAAVTNESSVANSSVVLGMVRRGSAVSTSETEGEDRARATSNDGELDERHFTVDSDVEMNSLGNNSFSEQAWDNYQEKYMSEPYSEAPDVETARRLLDFGDDYRNFLDSQSDCASSMSAVPVASPIPRSHKRHDAVDTTEDTDSDGERVRSTVENSESQFHRVGDRFSLCDGSSLKDCVEIACACRENLRCLHALLESIGGSFRNEKYTRPVRGMIERWESLSTRVEEAQMARTLHRDLTAMRMEFEAARDRLSSYEIALEQPHVLDDRIDRITAELSALRERKAAMLALNVGAHRLITDLGTSAPSLVIAALKDGVADLYRVWDETFQKGNQRLCALQAVQQFGIRLAELQCALRRDKDTLAVLDVALEAGATSEVASSVRHVARLLSEKQDVNCHQNDITLDDTVTEEVNSNTMDSKFVDSSTSNLTQEGGSLSDSGISDSGSEQELSERERRLAALRRLTRSLESQLPTDSETLAELWRRVEDAETELRDLRKQCRELIVRTAASVEARAAKRSATRVHHIADKRKRSSNDVVDAVENMRGSRDSVLSEDGFVEPGDSDDDPDLPESWVWRILRAALPFQLALVALVCAAYLLEPHCCEAANTLNLSLTPQLRYVRGPPPV